MTTTPNAPLSPFAIAAPRPNGEIKVLYNPFPRQEQFHAATAPNVVYLGSRGTGKSLALRMEAHARALTHPGFRYALLGLSQPDLMKNHLSWIDDEMELFFGGDFHKQQKIARYPNGSLGFYSHCSDNSGLGNLLGAEVAWLGCDEMCSMEWDLIRKVSASVRVKKGSGLTAMLRGATNPVGPSAHKVRQYFVEHDVTDDPGYIPAEWQAIRTKLADNIHLDQAQYIKQFAGLPPHLIKAWLEGDFAIEGAYFFLGPEHHAAEPPNLRDPHVLVYRAIDFGWHDHAVCLWIAVTPDGRATVAKERSWTHTTAQAIAPEIVRESSGMRIVETFCDPTMFRGREEMGTSVGDIFERGRVALTPSRNDREAAGYAICEWLNTRLTDGAPKLRLYGPGCPMLTKTLPEMRSDPKHPGRIADGNDHWVIALAYFCMAATVAPRVPTIETLPPWRRALTLPTTTPRRVLGRESVRRR